MFRPYFVFILSIFIFIGVFVFQKNAGYCATVSDPDSVCSLKDFSSFLEKYSEIAFERQVTCIQFPLDKGGKKIYNMKQFADTFGNRKFFFSPHDLVSPEAKPAHRFFDISNDNTVGKGIYGYFIEHIDAKRKKATFTEGGTFEFNTVTFEWDGVNWRVTDYRDDNEEYQ